MPGTTMLIEVTTYYEFENLCERIKKARKESPKTMTELAAQAGMSASNWYRIESDQVKRLPMETLRAMERALEVTLIEPLESIRDLPSSSSAV